jgi:hypothetical protein
MYHPLSLLNQRHEKEENGKLYLNLNLMVNMVLNTRTKK